MNACVKFAFSMTLVAMCLPATSALARKEPPPTQAQMVKMEMDFWNESETDQFRQAEANKDLDTMKALMNSIGIAPNPKFPIEAPPCLPPKFMVDRLSAVYGPNPNDNNIVEWYGAWLPICVGPKTSLVSNLWDLGG